MAVEKDGKLHAHFAPLIQHHSQNNTKNHTKSYLKHTHKTPNKSVKFIQVVWRVSASAMPLTGMQRAPLMVKLHLNVNSGRIDNRTSWPARILSNKGEIWLPLNQLHTTRIPNLAGTLAISFTADSSPINTFCRLCWTRLPTTRSPPSIFTMKGITLTKWLLLNDACQKEKF